jgi:acetylornithine deacetylase/succinyl-diaminopimelate desuccinylase-like protein
MDTEALLQRLISIQSIPAPTFHESERARHLERCFIEAGLEDVERDDISNVFGRLSGGSKRALVVSAHLDSVFPLDTQLQTIRRETRLVGPGVGDNALGLATLVELAYSFRNDGLPGDLWLVANIGEEGLGNLRGMRSVVDRFADSVLGYIVLEGMALGHIYHRGLPIRRYRIEATAAGGHSWIHSDRPSAVHALIELAESILELSLSDSPRSTLNIGRIEGGTTVNSIAPRAHMELDLRSEEEVALKALEAQLLALLKEKHREGVSLEADLIGERPGGGIPAHHPLVVAAQQSLRAAGVQSIQLELGSTDASLPLSLGLPAVCVGITHGGDAHTMEEYIELEPIPNGYHALVALIERAYKALDRQL